MPFLDSLELAMHTVADPPSDFSMENTVLIHGQIRGACHLQGPSLGTFQIDIIGRNMDIGPTEIGNDGLSNVYFSSVFFKSVNKTYALDSEFVYSVASRYQV